MLLEASVFLLVISLIIVQIFRRRKSGVKTPHDCKDRDVVGSPRRTVRLRDRSHVHKSDDVVYGEESR